MKTDARGVSAHYSYDELNRLTRRWYNGSDALSATTHNTPALPSGVGAADEAKFFYDAQSLPPGAPSFTRGASVSRPVAIIYGSNSSAGDYLGYDSAGRNVLKIQQTGGVNYQLGTTFNVAGPLVSLVYPSGRTVGYTYDFAGRTSVVTGNLGDGTSRTYATDLLYSSLGGLAKEKFGTTTPVYHKLHYNVRGQLYDVRASNANDESGGELGAIANYYSNNWIHGGGGPDNNGNLLMSQTIINSFYVEDRYSYDALNRLTAVNEYQNGSTNTGSQQYAYDRFGNRTINPASWGTGINNKQFTVNPANNRLGVPAGQAGAMSYDAAGNLTNDTYTGAGVAPTTRRIRSLPHGAGTIRRSSTATMLTGNASSAPLMACRRGRFTGLVASCWPSTRRMDQWRVRRKSMHIGTGSCFITAEQRPTRTWPWLNGATVSASSTRVSSALHLSR